MHCTQTSRILSKAKLFNTRSVFKYILQDLNVPSQHLSLILIIRPTTLGFKKKPKKSQENSWYNASKEHETCPLIQNKSQMQYAQQPWACTQINIYPTNTICVALAMVITPNMPLNITRSLFSRDKDG